MVELNLLNGTTSQVLKVERNTSVLLPRLCEKGKSFLGWKLYDNFPLWCMNHIPVKDTTLYGAFTDKPAYILESHFRGVPNDSEDERCHFRRYIVDVYLENAVANRGEFKIENVNYILYYIGNLPISNINASVTDTTNYRDGAYENIAHFSTSDVTVKWQSREPIDATQGRQKIATLMFCFGKWGMSYQEIEKRTSDEIIIPDKIFQATVDGEPAYVSANFYNGLELEPKFPKENPALKTVKSEDELQDLDFGKLLSRFAMMTDSHIGLGYQFENYNWIYSVFDHFEGLHKITPLDFVLSLGDNINDGYVATYKVDYEIYLDVIKKLTLCDPVNPIDGRKSGTLPHYEIQGNHDTSLDTRFLTKKLWYSQNADGQKVAFVAFSTSYGGYPAIARDYPTYRSYGVIKEDMADFVEQSILEAKKNGATHIVLCNHFGIAQTLKAPILPESGLGRIEALCNEYGIKLYLNGHEHNVAYTLHKYNQLYDYDAATTFDKHAVFELYEKYAKVYIYNSSDNSLDRIDVLDLLDE